MQVTDAVKKRASVRAYLDTPISEAEIRDWLTQAQRAPSGGNLQPWRVIVLSGPERLAVIDLAAGVLAGQPGESLRIVRSTRQRLPMSRKPAGSGSVK